MLNREDPNNGQPANGQSGGSETGRPIDRLLRRGDEKAAERPVERTVVTPEETAETAAGGRRQEAATERAAEQPSERTVFDAGTPATVAAGAATSNTVREAGLPGSEAAARADAARRGEVERRPVTRAQRGLMAFTWLSVIGMSVYAIFMVLAFFAPGYGLVDRVASWFLLLGLLYILSHSFGYANSVIKAASSYDEIRRRVFTPQRAPKVACVIASFNEPTDVLEETVVALVQIDYPNKEIIILDDSTKEEARLAARDIAARYGVQIRQRTNRRGYKAGAINDYLPETDAPYIAIFDADGLTAHNFLRDVMPIIEENPKLAFVQTPQYYSNSDVSNVALASARQQNVFYEYICEGKNVSRAAFCCGTDVVFRRDALLAVGGFDETSVTEDFATSMKMHMKGYDSSYYNQVYVYSLAPETLSSYFTQQSRWAFGSVGAMRTVIKNFFSHPGSMRPGQWWEYWLSSTYYWIGWVNFIFMLLPILYIFGNAKPLRADVFTYSAIFIPYLLFSMNMFYSGMEARGYRLGEMLLGQQIGFISFPIHMSAALAGILGRKRPFATTPKGVGGRLGWLGLWFQLLMLIVSAIAFVYGIIKYATGEQANNAAIVINAFWALYHVFLLSGIFRLNQRVTRTAAAPYFERTNAAGETMGTATPGTLTPGTATRVAAPRRIAPSRGIGKAALVLGLLTLAGVLVTGFSMASWYLAPSLPVNVYILDRTAGRDYQEHRALTWTLNFLKLHKDPKMMPGASNGTGYDWASDFSGFVPGDPSKAVEDPRRQGDFVVPTTQDNIRPLPALQTPGVVFLADAYGEFVEFDYKRNRYVRYNDNPSDDPTRVQIGITPDEVDRIETFYNNKGLVIGEWNTIGYPTLPGQEVDSASLQAGIERTQKGLQLLQTTELPQRQAQLARAQGLYNQAQTAANSNYVSLAQAQLKQTQDAIVKSQDSLKQLQAQVLKNANSAQQLQAQRRLQGVLHVNYRGWYGRFVDRFEEEHEYDFRLWKNVKDYLAKKDASGNYIHAEQAKQFGGPEGDPKGPGFVFYKDGPSKILALDDKGQMTLQDNPFSEPVVIFKDELGTEPTGDIATINKTGKPEFQDDPLLQNVAQQTPCRYWFDVVDEAAGTRVLAWYKLQITKSAADRLKAAGFPAERLIARKDKDGFFTVVFPAAVASREGGAANGALRSFYFAGDASDYSLVSRFNEMFPATGGVSYFLGHKAGPFSMRYYWNFYQPMLQNIFTDKATAPNIQHKS